MRISTTLLIWLMLIAAGPIVVEAATKYWDIDTTSQPGAGGVAPSGTWGSGESVNWNTNASGVGSPTIWSAGDSAVFAAGSDASGAYTVTVAVTQSLSGLAVEEGAVSQSGGTLNFGTTANAPIDIAAGASWSKDDIGTFIGTGGIVKSGAGTLSLRGTNTFSKSGSGSQAYLTINGGIVDFIADSNLGAVPPATDNGAALTINGGTLRFSAASGSAVPFAPNRGLRIGSNGGTIEVTNAASLALSSSAPIGAALNGSGTITKTGIGRFDLFKIQSSFTGKYVVKHGSIGFPSDGVFGAVPGSAVPDYFTLDGGGLRIDATPFSGGSTIANRGITLGANGGYLAGTSEGFSINGIIAGTQGGGLRITLNDSIISPYTTGITALHGVNTYDGPTQIDSGIDLFVTLLASGGTASAIGKSSNAASNLVLNGGTLRYSGAAVSTDRGFTLSPAGGSIYVHGGITSPLTFTSTSPIALSGMGPRTLTLTGTNSGNNTMSLAIADQGPNPTTLSKQLSGTWILTNTDNSYTGNTQVSGGSLKLGAAGVIPDGSLVSITGSGSVFNLNGFDETVRSVAGSSGTIALGTKTLTLDNPNGESYTATITGTGGGKIVKNGSGKFTLSPTTSTYDGGVTLNAGALGIGNDIGLGTGKLVVNNSPKLAPFSGSARTLTNAVTLNGNLTLDDSFTATPGPITWNTSAANQWTIAGADRTVVVNTAAGGYAVTINQVIGQDAPGRGLTKAGNGTLTLGAANTYTGNTGVQAGTLSIATPYLANTSDVYLATSSTFNLNFPAATPDVIDSLFINGVSQATGTWGAIGSGAAHEIGLITGTGLLQVSTFIPPLLGDFNSDGKVDASDYILWRKNNGTNNVLPYDNGLGTPIGLAHYNLWRDKFGNAPGSGNSTISAVPEPGALALLGIGLITLALPRRGCHRAVRFCGLKR